MPEGATGYELLQAAVETRCIESFETEWGSPWPWDDYYYMHRLHCVEDLCDQAAKMTGFQWWTAPALNLDYGFAAEGAVMEARYTQWACEIFWCFWV